MTNNQEVRELNERERADIVEYVSLGERICKFYLGKDVDSINVEVLDQVFLHWKEDLCAEKPSKDEIAYGLGCLFGQLFVNFADGKWKVVSDSHAIEVAVELPNGVQCYPCSSVWKRIDPDNNDLSFFEPIWHLTVRGEIDKLDYLDDPEV